MSVTSPDFESGAYTNFATPAFRSAHNSLRAQKRQPRGSDAVVIGRHPGTYLLENVRYRTGSGSDRIMDSAGGSLILRLQTLHGIELSGCLRSLPSRFCNDIQLTVVWATYAM